jgi:acyl-homoserine lactone acylase PvdQ
VLTSANQLSIVPEGALASVLGSNEAPGDRASRLRTLITARSDWTELELHKVQLDVYSARLVRWRDALLAALPTTPVPMQSPSQDLSQDLSQDSPHANNAAHAARALLVSWNGQVDADAAAPEIIDACRREVRAAMGAAIGSGAADGIDDEALLRMLESRAPHLLPAPTGGWSAFIARVLASAATATRLPDADAKSVAKSVAKSDAKSDARDAARDAASPASSADSPLVTIQFRTRGASNICAIRHPAADAFGPAAKLAEMPRAQLPGHPTCVRVQTPTFGASERSNISPAHLSDGVLVTPCGQAGMPTSPHFRDLHPFWQRGEPYPLLPGATKRRVELTSALAPPKVEPEGR